MKDSLFSDLKGAIAVTKWTKKERKRKFNVILANGLMLFYSSVISVCIDLFSIIYYYKQQLTKVSEWTCTFQLVFRNEGNGNGNEREWTL